MRNNNNNTILDKVISSEKEADLEQFDPAKVAFGILKGLKPREESVIIRRFNLDGKGYHTLDSIGKSYNITRERVRQIEFSILKDLKKPERIRNMDSAVKTIGLLLENYGNIMEESVLLNKLLETSADSSLPTVKYSTLFIMELSDEFERHDESNEFKKLWSKSGVSLDKLNKIINAFIGILNARKNPLQHNEIFQSVSEHDLLKEMKDELNEDIIYSYLTASKKINKNPFEEWGLVEWSEIVPKGVRDKAYLVLKRYKKPLHFRDISEKINKYSFDDKKAHPPTVHNELIKDERFVLVGRGIYALKEWGYRSGTVSGILAEILKEEKEGLSREEILEKMLKERVVKKNTVLLALQNKSKFKKTGDRYKLLNYKSQITNSK